MGSRQAHRLLAVASLSLAVAFSTPAYAQDDPSSEETAAKVLQMVKNANDEFDRGEYTDALEIYEEAYDLYPDPVLLYRIGLASEKSGDIRRAVDSYRAFVDASDDDDATAKRVAKKIPDLESQLAPLIMVRSTPDGADILLDEVDSEPIGTTPAELELSEGKQTVIVRLDGYRVVRRDVELENGQRETVDIELEKLTKLADVGDDDSAGETDGSSNIGTWGWISAGTGVALLGTGVVFSVLTSSATADVNDYDKRAPGASPEELDDLKSRAESLYDTSVATYIVGGVFTTIGAALLTVDYLANAKSGEGDETALRLHLAPTESGGWVGLSGRF